MLIPILVTVAVVLVALALFINSRPSQFRVSRSAVIPAPPSVVFAHVNDLHLWQEWSPWAKLDPNVTNTFGDTTAGTGAHFHWKGNKVGEGGMTISESRPVDLVRIRLDFVKPFKATNQAEFTFEPNAGGTLVTWSMTGQNNFMFKTMRLLMDCDNMCGAMFDKGLGNLKAVVQETAVAR